VDDQGRGPGSLVGRIELVVSHALGGNGLDARYFDELDGLFSGLGADEWAQARDAEERSCQEMREREERSSAEAVVRRMIEGRLAAEPGTPDAVTRFLFEGWARVMVAAYRDGGALGEPWLGAVALLEQLVWSVRPKREDDERRELLRRIPELLRGLREGMSRVSFDQRRLASLFRELKALHMAALRQADPGGEAVAARPSLAEPSDEMWRSKRQVPAVDEGGARGLPRHEAAEERAASGGLPAGTWLELRRDGGRQRVKLACYGPDSGLHLLVDRRGIKALELTTEQLAKLFGQGVATIVGQTDPSPVDRAFADLAESLGAA
jgi:hypothetical protein